MTRFLTLLLTREMLLRELFAGLGRLADLLSDGLPLVIFVVLDGRKQRRFLRHELVGEMVLGDEGWGGERQMIRTSSSANSA